jgi:hypothetical protein
MPTNMSTSHEAARDVECSTTLRHLLVSLLVLCALGVLLFGAVAAHSAATLRHPRQRAAPPSPAGILHRSPAVAAQANDPLRARELYAESAFGAAGGIERDLGPSTRYTVHVRLPNGNEQLIPITAPPGGLELEIRDMTGDNTANDLVLRPALIHWPLIVLLNDNHDHFTVAISSALPEFLESGDRLSGARQIADTVALVSSRAGTGPLTSDGQFSVPESREVTFSPVTQRLSTGTGHASFSGRAPPAIAT